MRTLVPPRDTLSLLAALMLAGCSPPAAPAVGAPVADVAYDGTPRDTLIAAVAADVESLISVIPQSGTDTEVLQAISLMTLQPTFDCRLAFEPMIARSWSFADDGATLSMELDPSFTWSDGAPVTARDVAFTYALIADPAVASPRRPFIEHMVPGAAPRVIDDTHLEFEFSRAYDPATMLAHAVGVELLPEHVLGDADRASLRGHGYHDAPVTNGPFRVDSRKPGQQVVLVPDEAWSGPAAMKPRLRRVILKVLPEYATRLLELEDGAVDWMAGVEVADADRLAAEHPEIQLLRRGWRAMEYVGWNRIDGASYQPLLDAAGDGPRPDPSGAAPHRLFADAAVRRALSSALDVDGLMRDLLGAPSSGEVYARRAVGTLTPSLCDVHADDIDPLPFDPAAARAALEAAGWRDTDGDGIRDRGGVPFSFELMVPADNPRRANLAVRAQAAWKDVGVEARIATVEFGTYVDRAVRKDFDALIGGWSAELFVDPSTQWRSGGDNLYNFVSFADPRVDALIEQGLSQPDPAESRETWHELQRIIYEDQPYTFLYWVDEVVAVHGRFRGAAADELSPFARLWTWWVAPGEVKYAL